MREMISDYVTAWNEEDTAERLTRLERCWADGGTYVDPNVSLKGRDALSEHIATVRARRPGARIELVSGVDSHHNVLRFLWRLVLADGTAGETSIDFCATGPDGRLTQVVGFFGPPPQA